MKDELAKLLKDLPRPSQDRRSPYDVRVGTVSSTSPVEVTLAASSDGLPSSHCSRYTPVLNDQVLILQGEGDLIIIDSITSGG